MLEIFFLISFIGEGCDNEPQTGHGLFSFAERFSNSLREPEYDNIFQNGLRDED